MSDARHTEESDYWTAAEAAAYLRRTPGTLRSWVRRGLLDVYHIAGRPLYKRSDIRGMVVGVQREAYSLRVSDVADAIATARMQHGYPEARKQRKITVKNDSSL